MRMTTSRLVAALAVAGLMAAAAAPAMAQEDDWPNGGTLKDGSTFTLNPRIAEKLANGEPINYLFSYQSSSIPLFSLQYQVGYERGLRWAESMMPINGTIVAPAAASGDVLEQVAQIQSQVDTGQVDCLSIQPATSDGFTKIANDVMAMGIPVFTVGVTSNGNELTNFTQVPADEGGLAAQLVIDWMEREGKDIKVFAVSGGDTPQFWAQNRMQGFIDKIMAEVPDARFINDASTSSTTYDPAATFSWYQNLLVGNPDLQFIENVDIGAEHANRAIIDAGKEGEVFTIGWNVSKAQIEGINSGTQVALLDQHWSEQAGFGAVACAEFLRNGHIIPNTQQLASVTKANSQWALDNLGDLLGS